MVTKSSDLGAEDGGRRRVLRWRRRCRGPTTVDAVCGAERFGAGVPGAGDAFGEHGLAGAGGDGAADGGSEFVACLAGGGEQQAGGGAELAGAAGDGGDVLLGQGVDVFGGPFRAPGKTKTGLSEDISA